MFTDLTALTTLAALGSVIRRSRLDRGLSAKGLADLAGVHRNTVHALESGRGNVELNTLLSLLRQLGLALMLAPSQGLPAALSNHRSAPMPTALQRKLAALRANPAGAKPKTSPGPSDAR